jgi:GAF domain-containing protein
MPGRSRDSSERLSLIVETQRDIAEAGHDLEAVMQLVAERSQALTGADGAMVNLIEGDMLHTRAVSGIGVGAAHALRPLSSSVAKYAIETGGPVLIEDAPTDPRINQDLRGRVGDKSMICVPLFGAGKVIGTINVMSRSERHVLREEHRETMEMISVVLSAAVSQAAEFEARRGQAEALARLRTLFEGVSIGILRLGRDRRAVEVNPALEQMLGYTAAEFAALGRFDYVHPVQAERAEVLFDELMAGRREPFQTEAQLVRTRPS